MSYTPEQSLNNLYNATRMLRISAEEHEELKKCADILTLFIISNKDKKVKKNGLSKKDEEAIEEYKFRKR